MSNRISSNMMYDQSVALMLSKQSKMNHLEQQLATGKKIVTSGIICDNPKLMQILDDNKIAIAADDVANESRPCLVPTCQGIPA